MRDVYAHSAGLLVHCFDSVEDPNAKWRPSGKPESLNQQPCPGCPPHHSWDLSTSIIFAEQTISLSGGPIIRYGQKQTPQDFLFGSGCSGGALIFRPGVARITCGNAQDCGGYCHPPCPSTDASTPVAGPLCNGLSWEPRDIHIYLQRETHERRRGVNRNNVYNEFLIDGRGWEHALPRTIEAFLNNQEGRGDTPRVHATFLQKYGLDAETVPLVEWTGRADQPLRVASEANGAKDAYNIGL